MPMSVRSWLVVPSPVPFFFPSKYWAGLQSPMPMPMRMSVRSGLLVPRPVCFFFLFKGRGGLTIPYAHAHARAHANARALWIIGPPALSFFYICCKGGGRLTIPIMPMPMPVRPRLVA